MAELRRVYVDSCCFIDMVKTDAGRSIEADRVTDGWFLKRLLEANRDKEVQLYTSVLSVAECSHIGESPVSDDVKELFTRFLMSGQYLRLVQVTPFIAVDARDLRWNEGLSLRGADAIHLASALSMGCEELLSGDGRLQRVSANADFMARRSIHARWPRQTDCLPAKYRQMSFPSEASH